MPQNAPNAPKWNSYFKLCKHEGEKKEIKNDTYGKFKIRSEFWGIWGKPFLAKYVFKF